MLGFAEDWVEEPEEPRRRKALASGTMGDTRSPATWVALAAGWSGGNVVPDEMGYAPADPEQTAKAVRVALFIASVSPRGRRKTPGNDGLPSGWYSIRERRVRHFAIARRV